MKKNDFLVLKRSDAVLKIHNWDFTFADYMTMCMINSVVFFLLTANSKHRIQKSHVLTFLLYYLLTREGLLQKESDYDPEVRQPQTEDHPTEP